MVTSDRTKWFALALLCVVQFMVVLDVAIVNVAAVDPGGSRLLQENLQWVISAYARSSSEGFFSSVAAPTSSVAEASSWAASSSSPSARFCAAWRGRHVAHRCPPSGLGAATVTPSDLSILTTTFTEARAQHRLGAWGAVGGFGAATASDGRDLRDLLSWEWIFFVNVPVGVAALILSPILLSESKDAHGRPRRPRAALVQRAVSSCSCSGSRRDGSGSGCRRRRSAFSPPRPCCSGPSRPGSSGSVTRSFRSRSSGCRR